MASPEKALEEVHIAAGPASAGLVGGKGAQERDREDLPTSAAHGSVSVTGGPPPEADLEAAALTQLMRLNAIVTGIVTGLVAGSGLFIATIWLVLKGGEEVGPHLSLLDQFFVGYTVTFAGSFVGFTYAFVAGFVIGFSVAWLYNLLVDQPQPSGSAKGQKKA